ncbi:uncharacterized protein A4U43_C10F17020 [Asparagus officinalis]|uniref:Uncharacterized protein n=1 Tax=Asparagus officinalis TaxID=4686 RepID=A0A5P1E3L4_ASPOF|nr:uncharacterized protein A4U43_C10F17020 [Asparagus officinalis]
MDGRGGGVRRRLGGAAGSCGDRNGLPGRVRSPPHNHHIRVAGNEALLQVISGRWEVVLREIRIPCRGLLQSNEGRGSFGCKVVGPSRRMSEEEGRRREEQGMMEEVEREENE